MEHAQRGSYPQFKVYNLEVLILILMEHAQRGGCNGCVLRDVVYRS